MGLIERGGRDEALGFDRDWEAVGELLDRGLFVAGGYATFQFGTLTSTRARVT